MQTKENSQMLTTHIIAKLVATVATFVAVTAYALPGGKFPKGFVTGDRQELFSDEISYLTPAFGAATAAVNSVTVTWLHSSSVDPYQGWTFTGYVVYTGIASGSYQHKQWVDPNFNQAIISLPEEQTNLHIIVSANYIYETPPPTPNPAPNKLHGTPTPAKRGSVQKKR